MAFPDLEKEIKSIRDEMKAREERGLPESQYLNMTFRRLRRMRYLPMRIPDDQ